MTMIGKTYNIKGTVIEIVEDRGNSWGVRSDTDPDLNAIEKQLLIEALSCRDAFEIPTNG